MESRKIRVTKPSREDAATHGRSVMANVRTSPQTDVSEQNGGSYGNFVSGSSFVPTPIISPIASSRLYRFVVARRRRGAAARRVAGAKAATPHCGRVLVPSAMAVARRTCVRDGIFCCVMLVVGVAMVVVVIVLTVAVAGHVPRILNTNLLLTVNDVKIARYIQKWARNGPKMV